MAVRFEKQVFLHLSIRQKPGELVVGKKKTDIHLQDNFTLYLGWTVESIGSLQRQALPQPIREPAVMTPPFFQKKSIGVITAGSLIGCSRACHSQSESLL